MTNIYIVVFENEYRGRAYSIYDSLEKCKAMHEENLSFPECTMSSFHCIQIKENWSDEQIEIYIRDFVDSIA